MKYSLEPVTTEEQLHVFQKEGKLTGTLKQIWENVFSNLPANLQNEVNSKNLVLEEIKELRGRYDKTY